MQIACGSDHTLAVSREGLAYAFGDNSLGQLGCQGSMGVQHHDRDPQQWIIKDGEGSNLLFSKVTYPAVVYSHKQPCMLATFVQCRLATLASDDVHPQVKLCMLYSALQLEYAHPSCVVCYTSYATSSKPHTLPIKPMSCIFVC